MIAKESRLIHRPDCSPEKPSPLCYCQKRKKEAPAESTVWQELGYKSEDAYVESLKRLASRDKPLFRNHGS